MRYIKSIYESKEDNNDYINGLINWNLIADIKDMALEYIDEEYTLCIIASMNVRNMSRGFNIYKLIYNHDVNKEIRESDTITKLDKFLYKDEYITYYILLFDGMPKLTMSYPKYINLPTRWLRDRVKEAYPKEDVVDVEDIKSEID